jgi:hypothetical protein
LIELAGWYSKFYAGMIQGMGSVLTKLVNFVINNGSGYTVLEHVEAYTVPLPISLDQGSGTAPTTFHTSRSRPSTLSGMDEGCIGGILDSILDTLKREFVIGVGVTSVNAASAEGVQSAATCRKKIMLVGASNLKKVAAHLESQGFEVADLCTPGWSVTPGAVAELVSAIKQIGNSDDCVLVLDLYGNNMYRYKECDGTASKPYKQGGGYHMAGEVVVCEPDICKNLVEMTVPIFECLPGNLKIVIPPMPRYLFDACCQQEGHCTNVGMQSHAGKLLGDVMALRNRIKKILVNKFGHKVWLADTCCSIGDAADMNLPERLSSLREVCAKDGVHFNLNGYRNMAAVVAGLVIDHGKGAVSRPHLKSQNNAAVPISGRGGSFAWHGFVSPCGSSAQLPQQRKSQSRDRYYRQYCPYSKKH